MMEQDPMAQLPAEGMPPSDDGAAKGSNTEQIVRTRLAQEKQKYQQKLDEMSQRHRELEDQLAMHSGQAQQQEQMIPVSAIPALQQQMQAQQQAQQRADGLKEKVNLASEQDPELKDLLQKGNHLPGEDLALIGQLSDLPNLPAVVKKLLKDKTDYSIFMSAPSDYEKQRLIKDMSEKLDGRPTGAASKKFEPAEMLSGSSPAGDDLSEYVDKYRGSNSRKR